jgi:hypothetical protein
MSASPEISFTCALITLQTTPNWDRLFYLYTKVDRKTTLVRIVSLQKLHWYLLSESLPIEKRPTSKTQYSKKNSILKKQKNSYIFSKIFLYNLTDFLVSSPKGYVQVYMIIWRDKPTEN